MRRFLVLALVVGMLVAVPAAGGAAVNGDGLDCQGMRFYAAAITVNGFTLTLPMGTYLLNAGETVSLSVSMTGTGSIELLVGADVVGTADSSGTLSWIVPSAGSYELSVRMTMQANSSVVVGLSCTPPPPPPPSCFGSLATIVGTGGDDVLVGTAGRDVIVGLGGDDVIRGLGGDDLLCGGNGDDLLAGGGGDDRLRGGDGDDTLLGRWGDDFLGGGDGADTANGGLGVDTCLAEARNACE